MASQDINEFHARLQRVTQARDAAVARPAPSRRAEIADVVAVPLSRCGAFLLGAAGMGIGSLVHFRFIAGSGISASPDIDLLIMAGIGATLSVVLGLLLRLSSFAHIALQALGVFAMLCTMHNLFHWLPAPMAAAFSPEHVAKIQASTPANSLIVLGRQFVLEKHAEEAAPPPTVGFAEQEDVAPGGPRRIIVTPEE